MPTFPTFWGLNFWMLLLTHLKSTLIAKKRVCPCFAQLLPMVLYSAIASVAPVPLIQQPSLNSVYPACVPVAGSFFSCCMLPSPAFFSVLKKSYRNVMCQAVGRSYEVDVLAVFVVGSNDDMRS